MKQSIQDVTGERVAAADDADDTIPARFYGPPLGTIVL